MGRQWFVNGENLVKVKGAPGGSLQTAAGGAGLWELGLSVDPISVTPRFVDQDIHCDDFGPEVPVDVLSFLADVTIRMRLIHFDRAVLGNCIAESMAVRMSPDGGVTPSNAGEGVVGPAGVPMGGGVPLLTQGNRWISLNILGPQGGSPFHFKAAKLVTHLEFPVGTTASVVVLNWRAIPYSPIMGFSGGPVIEPRPVSGYVGNILWDNLIDSP